MTGFGIQFDNAQAPATPVAYAYNLHSADEQGGVECTVFNNWPFFKALRVNGKTFLLGADGLHLMGGATDNGAAIASSLTLAQNSFDSDLPESERGFIKYLPWLHGGFSQKAQIYTLASDEADGEFDEDGPFYTTVGNGNSRRAQLSHGTRSNWWGITVNNTCGTRLKVSWLQFDFNTTKRRV